MKNAKSITCLYILLLMISLGCEKFTIEQDGLTDPRDMQNYDIVLIGEQWWMAENLNFKTDTGSWAYDSLPEYAEEFGLLYRYEIAREVCPEGWHLPRDEEWMELELAIGMDPEEVDLDGERGSIEDNESMKSVSGWNNLSCADGNGTNKSGFNALPAGHRYPFGSFDNMGDLAMFWTSSPIIEGYTAWRRRLPRVGFVERELAQVSEGLSVRCVKD